MSMYMKTVNRLEPAWPAELPNRVGLQPSVSLVTDVTSPGTAYQNASYGMSGLGAVLDDLMTLNFTALPGDILTGLNPATLDIGSYLIVGAVALLVLPGLLKGGKSEARAVRRRAGLKGRIAADQELLKA